MFLVELPDKTFLATLVLSTRYRPVLVWIGVGLAFAVQTTVAVLLGQVVTFLPDRLVQGVVAGMFVLGAVLLLREARSAADEDEESAEIAARAKDATGYRAIVASFLVLFAAEWGDLSQLLTITLVARYDAPVEVFVGALGALLTVSGLAVVAGRWLSSRVPLHRLMYGGAAACAVLAALTVYELAS
ncbi:TMEM165/GDT1 family protein [Nocardioides sp. TRM66260-LWL]|uniref:TMEM165/GDT1 family protein n=1 Tax=Nocardioides sp. TRM66260-LWL TaxID=2874478 RepID=UPI001CC578EA|nr:TMEM165/GDT1 family protein [Nocardioides sp. TRM66260-LWL]MBZ5735452.1 TMEM165/GDT1 family protein [Nocardioides sp. TRM66260-LWL]